MKKYIRPASTVLEMCAEEMMLQLSKVDGEVADTSDVLSNGNRGWNAEDWSGNGDWEEE